MTHKVIIIGGGPAGLSAAIYAARSGLKPLVFAPDGGQLEVSFEVGNYPGYVEDVEGGKVIADMTKQAERFGTEIIRKKITKVDFSNRPFKLWAGDEEVFEAESVIVATGSSARWLGVPGEEKYKGKGVSACATCDGFFFKDKEVIVVGGGDTAVEEALFLTKFVSKVYIVHRRDELRASSFMADRAKANEKIQFIWDTEVKEYLGNDKLEAVRLSNNKTNEEKEMKVDGVFVAIGHTPNTDFLKGQLELEKGYIVVNDSVKTSVEGVYAAGDVSDWRYQQAVVAAGFGVMAEMDAEKWLAEEGLFYS